MFKITGSQLLKIYLYLISFITLTVAVFTGAIVFKAAISYTTPLYFSYELSDIANPADFAKDIAPDEEYRKCYYDEDVFEFEGSEYCWDEDDRKQDLINGTSIFLSMLILFGIHQYGIKKTNNKKTPTWLLKTYMFVSLFTYSIIGIVAIPTAIYQVVNYLLTVVGVDELIYAPAYAIALVFLVLPLWLIFFKKTAELKD